MTELNFFDSSYQYVSSQRTFGLCDDVPPPHRPAYIDESNGNNWIAVVENANQLAINFIALDHTNIVLKKTDGQNDRCCDGCLNYNTTIIFVELTISKGRNWRKDKYEQLRITISHFYH